MSDKKKNKQTTKKPNKKLVFIDESRIAGSRYMLFGSLWVPKDVQGDLHHTFWSLWDKEFPFRNSELKWTKVSKKRLETYKRFIDLFLSFPNIHFRCVVFDNHATNYRKLCKENGELGFYQFLHTFLYRNIKKENKNSEVANQYEIFCDQRRQGDSIEVGRLSDLRDALNDSLDEYDTISVQTVDAINSHKSPEIQITDVLTGAVGYRWEGFQTKVGKVALAKHIESTCGLCLHKETTPMTDKVNIWKFAIDI